MSFTSDEPRAERFELQASSAELALLMRAAALKHVDLPSFVLQAALPRAESVVAEADTVTLSERDSLRVLAMLEHPPEPSPRLVAAAALRLERV